MKRLTFIYQILKYLVDNHLEGIGITLPKRIINLPGIYELIEYLLKKEYIVEPKEKNVSDNENISNRRFKITNRGQKYLQELITLKINRKNMKSNYITNALLALVFVGVTFDGIIEYKDHETNSEHTHTEQPIKISVDNFLTPIDSTDVITAELPDVKTTIQFLDALEGYHKRTHK